MIGIFVFAAFFYGAAEYEHMSGWKWAAASAAVTFAVMHTVGSILAVLPAQVVLFVVMSWQNSKRMERVAEERATSGEADRALRQERVRLAHAAADRRAQEAADRDSTGA
jgi:hypothetical protein